MLPQHLSITVLFHDVTVILIKLGEQQIYSLNFPAAETLTLFFCSVQYQSITSRCLLWLIIFEFNTASISAVKPWLAGRIRVKVDFRQMFFRLRKSGIAGIISKCAYCSLMTGTRAVFINKSDDVLSRLQWGEEHDCDMPKKLKRN